MMKYEGNQITDIKIAYIGGGSRAWAWKLMNDLVICDDISGEVALYDIDLEAARKNEQLGNQYNKLSEAKSVWNYKAVERIEDALTGADFVVMSILPATLNEMESDVHAPEKYGIYQSVGDTVGPGGVIRAMRCVPMYEYIAESIKTYCPDAWVINYTNPMTLCTRTLYRVFPGIKAFGCCHEVYGTQEFLAYMVENLFHVENVAREEIKVNVISVNHFTWLTQAVWKNIDLIPYFRTLCEKCRYGYESESEEDAWMASEKVKEVTLMMDLFLRFGYIPAAGRKHLMEFCEGKWYLENPERVKEINSYMVSVESRKKGYQENLDKSARLLSGEEELHVGQTGEEGVLQIRALLGLCDLVTNVNLPNRGQIPNLPLGAVVETNAVFRAGSLVPVLAGPIPTSLYPSVARICGQQEALSEAIAQRDLEKIFTVFANDPLTTCGLADARKLFKEMCENTKDYLTMYDFSNF